MKRDVVACAFVFVTNFCQELAKLDDIWSSYNKYKKNDVFFWDKHSVYRMSSRDVESLEIK